MADSWTIFRKFDSYDEALKAAEERNCRIDKAKSSLTKTILVCRTRKCKYRVNL